MPRVLPLTAELSAGARKGIPAWIDSHSSNGSREATWLELTYPMSSDAFLRRLYSLGDSTSLRAGMFMEEIDAFSADVAFRHVYYTSGDPEVNPPPTIVTAAHGNLSFLQALSAEDDWRLRGCVRNMIQSVMSAHSPFTLCLRLSQWGTHPSRCAQTF